MSTGEGEDPRDGQARRDGDERRVERIGVGGGDDSVSRIQLAARWAEAYAGENDTLRGVLHRFRTAYDYLDAVIHGVEPAELNSEADQAIATGPVAAGHTSVPPASWSEPRTPEPTPQAQPQPQPQAPAPPPWGEPHPPETLPPPPWAPPSQPEPGGPPSEPRPWG